MNDVPFHAIAGIFPLMDGQPLADLTEDIRQHGQHEPIWLYEHQILDGRNRYRACLASGVDPVFRVYEGDDPVGFVVSLNLHRRHLDESQRAISAAKAANHKVGNPNWSNSANSGLTTEQASEKFNIGTTAIKSAKQVLAKGIPELTTKVETGEVRVSTAADIATLSAAQQDIIVGLGEKAILMAAKEIRSKKAVIRQQENDRIRQAALAIPPPEGKYRCIVMDPPWPMQKVERDVRPNQSEALDYPVMSLEQIMAIDLPSADQCHLYLWTTQRFIWAAKDLLETWGFTHLAIMVWHKPGGFQPAGLPQYNCEFVLIGRRGGLEFNTTRDFPLCFSAPRREHSRKPDQFYRRVLRVSPEPRLDMFSREPRAGFAQFGAETHAFV